MKCSILRRSLGSWEIILNLGRDAQGIRRWGSVTFKGNKTQALCLKPATAVRALQPGEG